MQGRARRLRESFHTQRRCSEPPCAALPCTLAQIPRAACAQSYGFSREPTTTSRTRVVQKLAHTPDRLARGRVAAGTLAVQMRHTKRFRSRTDPMKLWRNKGVKRSALDGRRWPIVVSRLKLLTQR